MIARDAGALISAPAVGMNASASMTKAACAACRDRDIYSTRLIFCHREHREHRAESIPVFSVANVLFLPGGSIYHTATRATGRISCTHASYIFAEGCSPSSASSVSSFAAVRELGV